MPLCFHLCKGIDVRVVTLSHTHTCAQAATVLSTVERQVRESKGLAWDPSEEASFKQEIVRKYAQESSAYYSSSRIWDDGIVMPSDTRRVLALSLAACYQGSGAGKFGVFRM